MLLENSNQLIWYSIHNATEFFLNHVPYTSREYNLMHSNDYQPQTPLTLTQINFHLKSIHALTQSMPIHHPNQQLQNTQFQQNQTQLHQHQQNSILKKETEQINDSSPILQDQISQNNQNTNMVDSNRGRMISSSKIMKIDANLFITLKTGSIQQFYKLGDVLGEGAFGKVWKVSNRKTGLIRAMKSIKKAAVLSEDHEQLFSELNILKNLDHPHIVKLFELFEDNKNYYLITELLSGGDLFEKIQKINQFSEKKAADIMKQILMAIVYCHSQSIVHRDLKPENIIFLNPNSDQIKIIDFGTSRKIDPLKKLTKRLGTPYYIAPEVLNKQYDLRCDVWSCGVILFIMLVGYPPFNGPHEDEIYKKIKIGKFKFDSQDWKGISKDAKNLVTLMLNPNYKLRITAEQALNNIWIQKNAPQEQINKKSLVNLSQFCARSKFKQALLTFMATQMISQQEQQELQKSFQSIDINGDGQLTRDELIQGYLKVLGNEEKAIEEVEKIFDLVDLNGSGKVDYTEFIIAGMNQDKLLSVQKIKQAFRLFDKDGNGYIDKEELEYIMGELEDEMWLQILEECKCEGNRISLETFSNLLLSKIN